MRLKYGGTTIDLKLATAKIWAGCMLTLFIISTLYFLSNIHRQGESDTDGETPIWHNPDESVRIPLNNQQPQQKQQHKLAPDGSSKSARYNNEHDDVRMAMHSAKKNYQNILVHQRDILRQQIRPDDKHYNINVTLSDSISMDRVVKDSRPPVCRTFQYDLETLPKASVIIPFYNEALSMLLRTVHSILNNSPDILLNEVCM